ncbi:MAG: HAMP domain-containing sensor histidine kinase [Planctomycetaceae bacterium]|nr:HAMP domain-containing sensor histidine kinase [Planctomycetaceae bacterium]
MTDENVSGEFRPDADRLAALAEFAAGAGHEINNPLATIIGRAQQLLRDEPEAARRQSLAAIVAQAYRIRDMIGDVMAFARPPAPLTSAVDLSALVREAAKKLAPELENLHCRATLSTAEEPTIEADPVQIAIMVSELIRNAADALQPDGGEIRIAVTTSPVGAALHVSDSGRGFSELERTHAFDPFYSGRQAGRGLGFGLCKVWQIARLHRGQIAIESTPGGPTTVSVTLPQTRSIPT